MDQLPSDHPKVSTARFRGDAISQNFLADRMFDFTLREYLKDSSTEKAEGSHDFALPSELMEKANAIAAKARVDVDAVVEVALKRYFSQERTANETLPTILGNMTGIRVLQTDDEIHSPETKRQFGTQRRRFRRASANMAVSYLTVGETHWRRACAIDFSAGGVRICSAQEHAPGVQLTLTFRLPQTRRVVLARGRIAMSFFDGKTNEYSHGVAFTQIAHGDQEAIAAFVNDIRRTIGSVPKESAEPTPREAPRAG